ncbi:SDR family NAD(P)-dependent oxidoreductase [Kribbella sp. NPDC004875]|uniref:SDR family NAD(P)-dependent oxidoreductase n=1 Tax=Kribbella sp. NPDC004875 TaxID=3364107 RepID=UPI003679DCBA
MNVTDRIALVTGANRGIGRHFVLELLDRGASKVYATARRPETLAFDDTRVVPLRLDLLDHESVTAAAAAAGEVSLLVNNAGITTGAELVTGDLAEIRREMDTHFWGTLDVIRAFSPVLAGNGGGAIVNVLSALSWFASPGAGGVRRRQGRRVEHDERRTTRARRSGHARSRSTPRRRRH